MSALVQMVNTKDLLTFLAPRINIEITCINLVLAIRVAARLHGNAFLGEVLIDMLCVFIQVRLIWYFPMTHATLRAFAG